MSNLPENKTYIPTSGPTIPKVGKIFKDPAKQANFEAIRQKAYDAVQGVGEQTRIPDIVNETGINPTNYSFGSKVKTPTTPVGTSFFDRSTIDTFERAKPFNPTEYGYGFEYDKAPPEGSILRTTPNMGQWIVNPNSPDEIYRTVRPDSGTWNEIRKSALGGRSTSVFEVDHQIPIWLGGTNNPENLVVLSRKDHGKKTAVESVALTLLANGKISKDEAMQLSMTWKNRDVTDFPAIGKEIAAAAGNKGQLGLSDASSIYEKWKYQETVVPKVSMWEGFFTKENALGRGDQIDKATEWMPTPVQGVLKGFLSAGSMGAIQYTKEANNKGGMETFGNIAGQFVGSLIPVVGMSKLYGAALGLNKVRSGIKAGLAGKGIINTSVNVASKAGSTVGNAAVKTTAGVANAASATKRFVTLAKSAPDPAMHALIRAHADNFVRWTPAIVTSGQVQLSFEDNPERGVRLMEDILYGGLTGFLSPDLRGAAKAAFFTGVATSIFDGYSENREATWENAVVNGLLIGALHQMSAPAVKQQALQELNNSTNMLAHDVLSTYTTKLKTSDSGVPPVYTEQEVAAITADVQQNFFKRLQAKVGDETSPRLDDEEFARQSQAIGSALDAIRFSGVSEEQAPVYLAQRMKQWIDAVNDPSKRESVFGGPVPKNIDKIIESIPNDLKTNSIKYAKSEAYPSGVMRTTGLAEGYNPEAKQTNEFIQEWAKGNTSPTLVAVSRPERTQLIKMLSDDVSTDWVDNNPQNILQVFGRILKEDGTEKLVNLGYIPQESRIAGDKPYAFNNQPEIKDGRFPAYDPNVNKDTIAEVMAKEGVDYMFLTMNKGGHVMGADGKPNLKYPWVEFSIGDNNWRRSIDHQLSGDGSIAPRVESDGAEAVLKRLNTTNNEVVASKAKTDYLQNYENPAYTVLDQQSEILNSVDQDGIAMAKSYLQAGNEAFNQPTVEAMNAKLKEKFGFDIPEAGAVEIFNKRGTITVRDFFSILEKNSDDTTRFVLKTNVYPPISQLMAENTWEYRKIFGDIKLIGKNEAPAPAVNQAIAAPETPVASVIDEATPTAKETPVEAPVVSPEKLQRATAITDIIQAAMPEILPPAVAATAKRKVVRQSISEKLPKVAEILIPESTPMLTSRQEQISRAIDDTVQAAESKMSQIKRTEYLGDEGLKKQLMSAALNFNIEAPKNLKPGKDVAQKNMGAIKKGETYDVAYGLTPHERGTVKKFAGNRIAAIAMDIYNTANSPGNAITFMTNGSIREGDEFFDAALNIYNAKLAREFNFNYSAKADPLIEVRQQLGNTLFERVYKLMYPRDASKVKEIGKAPKTKEKPQPYKTPVGYKGGMLGDDTNITKFDMNAEDGKRVVKDLIDSRLEGAKNNTYFHAFASTIDKILSRKAGKDWRSNKNLLGVFGSIDGSEQSSSVWKNILLRSEGDATQPLAYLEAMSRGQKAKGLRILEKRRNEVFEDKQRVLDETSGTAEVRTIDNVNTKEATPFNEALASINDSAYLSLDESGMRMRSLAQLDDENIPAPSAADSIFAGMTVATHHGYLPTAEQGVADAVQFAFALNRAYNKQLKLNTVDVEKIVDEVIQELSESGVKLTQLKNKKQTRKGRVEAVSLKNQADELLTGSLAEKFRNVIAAEPNYKKLSVYKGAQTGTDKLIAVGGFLSKQKDKFNAGILKETNPKNGRVSPIRLKPEAWQFVDEFNNYQQLMEEFHQLKRRARVETLDTNKDGKGYAPIDGQGGFFGEAWNKVKGFFNNTVEYTKPESSVASAAAPTVLPPQPEPSLPKPPPQPTTSYKVKGHDLSPEDFEDLTRIAFSEVGNRSPEKQRLEMQVFLDTIATRAKQGYMGDKNIMDVVRRPDQYQGYTNDQYKAAKAGTLDYVSQQKYDAIRAMLLELANSEIEYPYPFYVHANDGTIRTGDDFQHLVDTYLR